MEEKETGIDRKTKPSRRADESLLLVNLLEFLDFIRLVQHEADPSCRTEKHATARRAASD
jgi:hypothetical protein